MYLTNVNRIDLDKPRSAERTVSLFQGNHALARNSTHDYAGVQLEEHFFVRVETSCAKI